ncbi:MAG: efflux RND transporter permease subunit, partial [Bacteroidota bacterium]|nr:efflux RND transporter permease subunit [Bacteroidota bacterium]
YETLQDTNEFLDASIHNVVETLIEAFLLVFLVVFIFLQDLRSTLIPAIAVPVAIIGTFFFLDLFGFTINLLTLFALILAIGIVVDDAIVVVEAVHAKMDAGAPTAKRATIDAMGEITGAIISITLVMAAVFLPVTFLSGTAGVFYRQFGITLAVAIVISAINALTLSPALCVLFLKPGNGSSLKQKGVMRKFYGAFNASFSALTERYKKTLSFLVLKKWIALLILASFTILLVVLMKTSRSAFVPEEDMGTVFTDIQLQPGSSLDRTKAVADKIDSIIGTVSEIKARTKTVGRGLISGTGSTYAGFIIKLKPWDDRKGQKHNIKSIIAELYAKTAGIKDAKILFIAPPTLSGFSLSGGFSMELQDRGGNGVQALSKVSDRFLAALRKRPEIQKAITSFNPNFPQYQIDVNVAKSKESGVSISSLLSTLQGYYGGIYASDFNEFGKQYRVMVQADPQYRTDPASLNGIYVRNDQGRMAPISEFITLKKVFGPETISRFNMYTDISITGSPQKGYSTGDAIAAIQQVAKEVLPAGYGYEFSGMTREEVSVGHQSVIVFILCVIFVYFLLAAQYESYIIPFSVILSLPVGLSGTFLFAKIMNIDNNIYLQISLIMLIGLLAKNAILIVEFALQRRRRGMSIRNAAIEGAFTRLRPILMTSLAFIVGLSPLIFSSGAGANGNKSIGTGAIGGMLVGTAFGVLIIPILFIIFQILQEKVTKTSASTSQREQEQTIKEELEE